MLEQSGHGPSDATLGSSGGSRALITSAMESRRIDSADDDHDRGLAWLAEELEEKAAAAIAAPAAAAVAVAAAR